MPVTVISESDQPIVLPFGEPYFLPVTLFVEVNGGSVTIEQFDERTQTYFLPTEPENNITVDGNVEIERANRPGLRITPQSGAFVTFFGEIR